METRTLAGSSCPALPSRPTGLARLLPPNHASPGKPVLRACGQRRVRRAPTVAYDNPASTASGLTFAGESFLFNGALDSYEWKLLGKQEMFVPCNTQKFHTAPVERVFGPVYPNPDYVRWELHRVRVVEATVAPGERHVLPRRRFYLDEDSWFAVLSDGWVVYPYIKHDLLKGGYVAASVFNGGRHYDEIMQPRPESDFSPAALAAQDIR